MRNVAVIFGGPSLEHEVSVSSGLQVLEHLDRRRYRPLPVLIERSGGWTVDGIRRGGPLEGALALREAGCDIVFLALHGPFGEDGTIQGFLETIGMPFTGSGSAGSAFARDKVRAKRLLATSGIEGAPDLLMPPASPRDVADVLGFPVVLKNPHQGSSLGLAIVHDEAQLERAAEEIRDGCAELLVERCEKGREFTAPVLDTDDGHPECLPIVEIRSPDGFFDYEAKYTAGVAEEIVPAPVDAALARRMQEIALRAHHRLALRGMSRTDFIVRESGEPVFLETNSIPGLTPNSLLPKSAAAAGVNFSTMLSRLLESALPAARCARTRELKTMSG